MDTYILWTYFNDLDLEEWNAKECLFFLLYWTYAQVDPEEIAFQGPVSRAGTVVLPGVDRVAK